MDWKAALAAPLMAVVFVAGASGLKPPKGWSFGSTGANASVYAIGIDAETLFQGQRSISVQSQGDVPPRATSHAAAIQYAYGYQGRRVRFSGWLRTADVKTWAGAFVRVDGEGTERFFGSRPDVLKERDLPFGAGGAADTKGWTEVSIVVDAPDSPQGMVSMGVMVLGQGKAWLSAMRFEEVGPEVPLTESRIGLDLFAYAAEQEKRKKSSDGAPKRPQPPKLSLE